MAGRHRHSNMQYRMCCMYRDIPIIKRDCSVCAVGSGPNVSSFVSIYNAAIPMAILLCGYTHTHLDVPMQLTCLPWPVHSAEECLISWLDDICLHRNTTTTTVPVPERPSMQRVMAAEQQHRHSNMQYCTCCMYNNLPSIE